MNQARRAESQGARGEAAKFVTQAEQAQQTATQFGQKAREIANTEEYQKGSLLVQNRNADAAMIAAQAQRDRANALGRAGGEKGVLTPKDIAALRDKATDNVKGRTLDSDLITAKKAAVMAGKPFDKDTWLNDQIDKEFNRLIEGLQTGKGVSIMRQPPPTGGKLGGGTYNPDAWKEPIVVTPK